MGKPAKTLHYGECGRAVQASGNLVHEQRLHWTHDHLRCIHSTTTTKFSKHAWSGKLPWDCWQISDLQPIYPHVLTFKNGMMHLLLISLQNIKPEFSHLPTLKNVLPFNSTQECYSKPRWMTYISFLSRLFSYLIRITWKIITICTRKLHSLSRQFMTFTEDR